MESSDRKATAFYSSDRRTFHVPPYASLNGADVSMPLHFLGHPIGYSVLILWCFPAGFPRDLWPINLAAWTVFPRSVCRNGYSHFVRSYLAPKLRSLGA